MNSLNRKIIRKLIPTLLLLQKPSQGMNNDVTYPMKRQKNNQVNGKLHRHQHLTRETRRGGIGEKISDDKLNDDEE